MIFVQAAIRSSGVPARRPPHSVSSAGAVAFPCLVCANVQVQPSNRAAEANTIRRQTPRAAPRKGIGTPPLRSGRNHTMSRSRGERLGGSMGRSFPQLAAVPSSPPIVYTSTMNATMTATRMVRFADAKARAVVRDFDLRHLPDDFIDDPFPYYRALRDHDPVHRMSDGGYFISRYRDCEAVYKDVKTFSSDKKVEFKPKYGDSPLYEHHTTSLVFNDPPLHTHVRRAIIGALSARTIADMEPGLIALVDRLLDAMVDKRRVDLIEDFAAAIPIEIIGNLLGVPREERHPLRGWSLAILGALEPVLSDEQLARGNAAVRDFLAYLKVLVDDRRKSPGDPESDVLTRLI